MKNKSLVKIFNVLIVFALLLHMFMPLTVNAITTTKKVRVLWKYGNYTGVSKPIEIDVTNPSVPQYISASSIIPDDALGTSHTIDISKVSSFYNQGSLPQWMLIEDTDDYYPYLVVYHTWDELLDLFESNKLIINLENPFINPTLNIFLHLVPVGQTPDLSSTSSTAMKQYDDNWFSMKLDMSLDQFPTNGFEVYGCPESATNPASCVSWGDGTIITASDFKGRQVIWINTDYDTGTYEIQRGFSRGIDPTGAKDGPHSIASNGDREFRLIIYDEDYASIEFDVDADTYTYYLNGWDPTFTNPVYDLSTDIDNPTVYETYLLEDTLVFKSNTVGDKIVSAKALDVPNKGVSITNPTSDSFKIEFKSNYYSNVMFELTGESGKKYYLRVDRTFVTAQTNNELILNGFDDDLELYAEFIYPSEVSYQDFDVIATITTTSGETTKKLNAVNTREINREYNPSDPSSGEQVTNAIAVNAGVNLKKTRYLLDVDSTVKSVRVTITNKDAVSGDTYGGTFGGYGSGVELDLTHYLRQSSHN